ncbi:MAG: hypothetical protein QGF07_02365 [Phycisphaerales bacterium]|nr:hypothetical protein [Phycisphaerales bacterium]
MKYLLLTSITIILSNCSPIATYPTIEVDAAVGFSNSSYEPVPTILVATIEYARDHFGGIETVVYNLPKGMVGETYDIVGSRVENSRPMQTVNEPAYHITELRVRGLSAEADIVFPSTTGGCESATVYLSKSFTAPWKVNRERIWLIPITEAPLPNFSADEQSVSVDLE